MFFQENNLFSQLMIKYNTKRSPIFKISTLSEVCGITIDVYLKDHNLQQKYIEDK